MRSLTNRQLFALMWLCDHTVVGGLPVVAPYNGKTLKSLVSLGYIEAIEWPGFGPAHRITETGQKKLGEFSNQDIADRLMEETI